MICNNCKGNIPKDNQYCTQCGHEAIAATSAEKHDKDLDENIIFRIGKVVYVTYFILLALFSILIAIATAPYYSTYSEQYIGSTEEMLGYSILTFLVGFVLIRLVKIVIFYIAIGRKPSWYSEFRKFF